MKNKDKLPFTKNTREVRIFLESLKFRPLSFFQGGDFIYPLISTCGNKYGEWKEYDYSTFNLDRKDDFIADHPVSFEEFTVQVNKLIKDPLEKS